jgi:hypothetical protein
MMMMMMVMMNGCRVSERGEILAMKVQLPQLLTLKAHSNCARRRALTCVNAPQKYHCLQCKSRASTRVNAL